MLSRPTYASQSISNDERYFQRGTALNRFFVEAPYLSRCSDNKTAALVRPREYAIRYPYMQVNQPDMVSWLIFDLDHSNPLIWENENLPPPNLVVKNRKNGHSHLYYAIAPVCTSENARSKPIAYTKAIYEAMAARLDADPSYSGPVAKTPGHPWWHTWEIHAHEYELGELADSLELAQKPPWSKGPDLDSVSHSRHCLLFEDLRFYAYSIVNRERDRGSYLSFKRLLEAFAHNKNNFIRRGFSMNLTFAQVMATVKSVARWTWHNYRGTSKCHRGVMNLDKTLSLREKQTLAAKRTHQERKTSTESKIRAACRALRQKGITLTQQAVAKATSLCRQTIAKYQHILAEIPENNTSNITPIKPAIGRKVGVNYALHQISGGGFELDMNPKTDTFIMDAPVQEVFEPPD